MDRKSSQGGSSNLGGHSAEQNENVREGFGDDMGTRVGRPDPGAPDDRSMARLSGSADERGIEGAVLGGSDNPGGSPGGTEGGSRAGSAGQRSSTRADGSSMEGDAQTLDHAQRAQSGTPQRGSTGGSRQTGAGGEANRGVDGAKIERGSDEQGSERAGSEPLRGRQSEHKPSYGGEGGEPRTSSDQRERGLDYYGDEGSGKEK